MLLLWFSYVRIFVFQPILFDSYATIRTISTATWFNRFLVLQNVHINVETIKYVNNKQSLKLISLKMRRVQKIDDFNIFPYQFN